MVRARRWLTRSGRGSSRYSPTGYRSGVVAGVLRKGLRLAGAQRRYSGTAGRRIARTVSSPGYATDCGRTLIDRTLYLPAARTDDREGCRRAGITDGVGLKTKVATARAMVRRAIDNKAPYPVWGDRAGRARWPGLCRRWSVCPWRLRREHGCVCLLAGAVVLRESSRPQRPRDPTRVSFTLRAAGRPCRGWHGLR